MPGYKPEKYDPDYEHESCMVAGEWSVFDGSPLVVPVESANQGIISASYSFYKINNYPCKFCQNWRDERLQVVHTT